MHVGDFECLEVCLYGIRELGNIMISDLECSTLAQGAAYISHGSGKNEEINLFGIDGSKPGAASAGVWLSHKVIGLHSEGYGLLLRQCTFSGDHSPHQLSIYL